MADRISKEQLNLLLEIWTIQQQIANIYIYNKFINPEKYHNM